MRVTNLSQEQWPYWPPATAASWQSPSSRRSCRSGSFLLGRVAASYEYSTRQHPTVQILAEQV